MMAAKLPHNCFNAKSQQLFCIIGGWFQFSNAFKYLNGSLKIKTLKLHVHCENAVMPFNGFYYARQCCNAQIYLNCK